MTQQTAVITTTNIIMRLLKRTGKSDDLLNKQADRM